jgi:Flp pilus assembly protein TadG
MVARGGRGKGAGDSRWRSERGAALIEAAITLPLLLFISVGIIEFGRVFQTWQVVTNAAREGARVAVLSGMTDDAVRTRVQSYLQMGIDNPASATITIDRATTVSLGGAATAAASKVEVDYPFTFIVMQPLAQLLATGSTVGDAFTMTSAAVMRNE